MPSNLKSLSRNLKNGRMLTNYQFLQNNLPPIIIRDKEKKIYYKAFKKYQFGETKATKEMEDARCLEDRDLVFLQFSVKMLI